jgi:hypothetical protein
MCEYLKLRYLRRVWDMRSKYSMHPIKSYQEKIISCIMNIKLSYNETVGAYNVITKTLTFDRELNKLVFEILWSWMKQLQDPMVIEENGVKSWSYSWLDNNLMQPWILHSHHLNTYNINTAYALYKKCLGKISLWDLPDRLNKVTVEQVDKDVADKTILRDVLYALREVEKSRRPKANIRITRVDSSL